MENFKKVIDKIRDIIRPEGITGMESVYHCIVFVVSRMLNNEACKKLNIDNKYSYEKMMIDEDNDEIEPMELMIKFYTPSNPDCFIGLLVRKFGFKNEYFRIKSPHNLKKIMMLLKDFDIKTLEISYDIIGTIYEIHLKSGTSNSRDLGQFYTHRLVIEYMINLCDPKLNKNGNIDKIVDSTMGTGGFLTMAIKYLNKKYKNKINWNKNKNNIYGFDIDEKVKNMALINIFLEIGELCEFTIVQQDTLQNDLYLDDRDEVLNKVDIVLANEPMGIKNIIYNNCCDRIKKLNIKGIKAELLFLQLFGELLNDKGKCVVIVPDGVLFNDANVYRKTRQHIIDNFNLKKVIALDEGFFINTGVKTSILYFEKNGKTENIEFGKILLKDNKINENIIIKVKYDKIKENKYSLFINKYLIKEIVKLESIEYKKISELFTFLPKSKKPASFGKLEGSIPFYTSGTNIKRCDIADVNKECLIIGQGGNANIYYDTNFSCSTDNFIITINNNKNVLIKYVYYYLFNNLNILNNGFKGSTIKHLSKDYLNNILIPIPNINVQKEIINKLDEILLNNKELENKIISNNKLMKSTINNYFI